VSRGEKPAKRAAPSGPFADFDQVKFGRAMTVIVRDFVERQIAPLEARLAALEAQAGIAPPRGKPKRQKP
jgi:hypothetical protein